MTTLHVPAIVLVLFPLAWLALLSVLYVVFMKKSKINYSLLVLYISFTAMIGPFGEILVGTFYELIIGHPLWQYQIMPTHNTYTSLYAPIIWGIAGVVLYFSNELLKVWAEKHKLQKALFFMVETILVEVLLNLTFLVLAGGLIFYYLPGDLLHVTSFQTLPFYFILGVGTMVSIKRMRKHPGYFSALCILLMCITVYLTS